MSMKFEYQYEPNEPKITIEVPKDSDINQVISAFRAFLLACTFNPKTVNEALGDE